MRTLSIFILVMSLNSVLGQNPIRSGIDAIVSVIVKGEDYTSSRIGYEGITTPQWKSFLALKAEATPDELRQLASHSNPVVRCYSFQALAERKDSMTFEILLNHLSDNAYVNTFQGCVQSETIVGDFFLGVVSNSRYPNPDGYALTGLQQQKIDSLLIFEPKIRLYARERLLRDIKPRDTYHQRIRELVVMENLPTAAIALARFKDERDVEIIKSLFEDEDKEYFAIYATREFPHNDLYPQLVRIFEREWDKKTYNYSKWRMLFQALAQYDNDKTLELFEQTISAKKKSKRQNLGRYLMIALRKYPTENFENLIPRIKLDHLNMNVLDYEMNIEK